MDEASGKDLHQHDTHFPNESQQAMSTWPTAGGSCVHAWVLMDEYGQALGYGPGDDRQVYECLKCRRARTVETKYELPVYTHDYPTGKRAM